ncbi:MAG TPA: adenylate/guanylate cyclase domain-containing protein [Methylomirabilota bacterium]
MRCPRCQTENDPGMKYCGGCGARLALTCSVCGTPNSAAQKFCGQCGAVLDDDGSTARYGSPDSYTPKYLAEKILTSRSSLEGERKQVTVMFADMKSSLELLADRDPEEVRSLLDPVLKHMMDGVHQFEGTVNQVMGDGIMAIFGAPVAHEDHAIRACYAALSMQKQIARYAEEIRRTEGLSIQVRIGVNSGEVVVRSIGSDLHMDYTAVGQTTHLAARMEQMATPGSVLITGDSLRLAEGYVEVKALGPVPVKGLAKPIEVYEVVAAGPVRSRLQAATARGLTPFVGRTAEMALLYEALERAGANHVQILALLGEPGVGKSRLVYEFVHSEPTSDWLLLEARSTSYGRTTPYLPVIELLKSYCKIEGGDSARTIREKVTDTMLTLDSSLEEILPPLWHLLDALPDDHRFRWLDPLQHRQQTYQAVIRVLMSEVRARPVVAVFEDLHWTDSLTLGLLNELVTTAPSARLLLLVSYRPEHQDDWKARPNYRQLRLEPLANENLAILLEGLLGSDASLSTLKEFLLARTGGNPFFIEEMARILFDTGVIAGTRGSYRLAKPFFGVHVPPTVQAMLAARIDRLPAAEKRLLQEAAVIGTDVPYALLHGICGLDEDQLRGLLGNLQAAEFLNLTQLFPEPHYTFKHSLTHEVAYSGLLQERRRDLHARIVGVIEQLYADRLGEHVERLADHALRGQLRTKALTYLRQAGAKAAERQAFREAAALYGQALDVVAQLPETRSTLEEAIDLRFEMRNVLQPLGDRDRIAAYLREAEQLAARLDDPYRAGWIQSYLTEHFWILGRYAEAAAAGERALTIARKHSETSLHVVTNLPLGLAYHCRGDYGKAIEYFQWNVARLGGDLLRERFGMFVLPSAFSRSFIAWALADLGRFAEASETAEDALRIAEAAEHPFSCGYAHLGIGVVFLRQRDVRRAVSAFERALAAGGFSDSPVGFAYVAFHLGYALALGGRVADGVGMLEKTVEIAEARRFVARHALRLAHLGEAYLLANRIDDADATATRALDLARAHEERANEAYALRVLGEVETRRQRAREAQARFQSALLLAERLEMRPLQMLCHLGLARSLEETSAGDEARGHRACAETLSRSMGVTIDAGVS